MPGVTQIGPAELKAKRDNQQDFCLLDVREPWEVALARISGSLCIPLHEIPSRLQELAADSEIIVMCKAGGRSQRAAEFLVAKGFKRISNLQGGIDAWAREIDPTISAY